MITDKNKLLRAIGDIDDKYIKEILSEDAEGKQNVVKVPFNQRPIIRNMKYYLPAAAALLIVVACIKSGVFSGFGATSSSGNAADSATADYAPQAMYEASTAEEADYEPNVSLDMSSAESAGEAVGGADNKDDNSSVNYANPTLSEDAVDMINPFIDCRTLEEAEEIAGFEFNVPDDLEPDLQAEYRALEGILIEVIYYDRGEEIYRIRKGTESDVSGDYNDYSVSVCVDASTWAGELKGYKEGLTNCAVWTDMDGFGYSLTTEAAPIKTDRVIEIIDLLMQ
ncbi:MAG: hypothetical protein J6T50_02940 [Lachnospiraceae bacterium]|nr:hypothetical protein [Lachnospiraceae bacterium]